MRSAALTGNQFELVLSSTRSRRWQVTQESAPQRERGSGAGARLSSAERAALIARLDGNPTRADWAAYDRELDALLASGSR
jgi:hypothetical protein